MRKAIMIGEEPKGKKGIEFTHCQCSDGWNFVCKKASYYDKIVYLGKCRFDGDMFAAYGSDMINIYKGKLNNGTY